MLYFVIVFLITVMLSKKVNFSYLTVGKIDLRTQRPAGCHSAVLVTDEFTPGMPDGVN